MVGSDTIDPVITVIITTVSAFKNVCKSKLHSFHFKSKLHSFHFFAIIAASEQFAWC